MFMIISLSGNKGSGKDYSAEIIKDYFNNLGYSVNMIAFADKVKEMLSVLTGIPLQNFNDTFYKNNYMINLFTFKTSPIDDRCNFKFKLGDNVNEDTWISIRMLMQNFGTDLMQQYYKEIWVRVTLSQLKLNMINIVTDTRFKHELNALKKMNATTIKINSINESNDSHISENDLNGESFDLIVTNNKDENYKHQFLKELSLLWKTIPKNC